MCWEPGIAPRGTKGNGRLSVSVPWFCWLSAVWSTGCGTSSQLAPFTVKRTLLRERGVSLHPLLGQPVDPKHSTKCRYLLFLSLFSWFLCFCQWEQLWCRRSSESSLLLPVSGQALTRLCCAGSFVFCQVPEAGWGGKFWKALPSASTYSWSLHIGVYT